MGIAKKIEKMISRQSWIRQMFEEGDRLKKKFGAENVYDFSIGNPNINPPDIFKEQLKTAAEKGNHGYMPNAGYPETRKSIGIYLRKEQQTELAETDLIMTCGASGALNIAFKALLDPGDIIITPAPYFVEYNSYADNHGGILKQVQTNPDFTINLDAIGKEINEKTKAVLINSPNNPTGQIYSEQSIKELGQLLQEKQNQFKTQIYLIADEPYRKIVFDGEKVPAIFPFYPNTIIAASYSKDISVPGERIGFAAINPACPSKQQLADGMTLANRILGFVNAPALMQRVIAQMQGVSVDISEYKRKRDIFCDGLSDCGYEFTKPKGTFYLFPKSPIKDDVEFVKQLQKERILVVPGSGFGGPEHFRIAFCVEDSTIINSMPGFKKAIESCK